MVKKFIMYLILTTYILTESKISGDNPIFGKRG